MLVLHPVWMEDAASDLASVWSNILDQLPQFFVAIVVRLPTIFGLKPVTFFISVIPIGFIKLYSNTPFKKHCLQLVVKLMEPSKIAPIGSRRLFDPSLGRINGLFVLVQEELQGNSLQW